MMKDEKRKEETFVKPHRRKNKKSKGTHQVSGHTRRIDKKRHVEDRPQQMGGSGESMSREERFEEAKKHRLETDEEEVRKIFEDLFPEEEVWYNWGDVNFKDYGGVAVKRWQDELVIAEVMPLKGAMSDGEIVDIMGNMNLSEETIDNLLQENFTRETLQERGMMNRHPEDKIRFLVEQGDYAPYNVSEIWVDADELSRFINSFPEEESDMGGWSEVNMHDPDTLKDMDVEDFVMRYVQDSVGYSADPRMDTDPVSGMQTTGTFLDIPFDVEEVE